MNFQTKLTWFHHKKLRGVKCILFSRVLGMKRMIGVAMVTGGCHRGITKCRTEFHICEKCISKFVTQSQGVSDELEKNAYILLDKPEYYLVHYLGDESTHRPLPHDNSKPGAGSYVRTCPSVLKNMRKHVETESSGNVYKKMVTEIKTGVHHGVLNPRNLKQVQNVKCNVINDRRYSKDDLYNLLQLAYHFPDTIWKIDLYPDMACVLGIKDVMDELNTILETKQGTVLSYDTTFELGDFYVSPLVFPHTVFDSEPVVSVAFLIQDRKFPAVHEIFFNVLKSKVPNLCKKKFVVVMDMERSLKTNSIPKSISRLPNSALLEPHKERSEILATKTWRELWWHSHLSAWSSFNHAERFGWGI